MLWVDVCWLNTVSPVLIVNEQTWDLVSTGNSSEMNNGECVNNSQPLCSSLCIPHCIHVKPTISSNFKHEYRSQTCSVLFYQANVVHILQTKNGDFNAAAENPSLLVRAQCARHYTRENSLAWKSFQSNHGCQMDIGNEKKCCGNSYTGCPSNLPIKCIL